MKWSPNAMISSGNERYDTGYILEVSLLRVRDNLADRQGEIVVDKGSQSDSRSEIWSLLRDLADGARDLLGAESDLRFRLLRRIGDSGRRGLSQIEAANALGVSGSTLSRLSDNLELSGLIERVAHPNDRRVRTLHLTPKGTGQLSLSSGAVAKNRGTAVSNLTPQEVETLKRLLTRIAPPAQGCRKCEGCNLDTCMAA